MNKVQSLNDNVMLLRGCGCVVVDDIQLRSGARIHVAITVVVVHLVGSVALDGVPRLPAVTRGARHDDVEVAPEVVETHRGRPGAHRQRHADDDEQIAVGHQLRLGQAG